MRYGGEHRKLSTKQYAEENQAAKQTDSECYQGPPNAAIQAIRFRLQQVKHKKYTHPSESDHTVRRP
ncbi:hypothetical protein GCM10027567_00540 [Spongiibacter taiwanensis]